MKKLAKITALICAISIVTVAAGCGGNKDESSSAIDVDVTEGATTVELEEKEQTEESVEEDTESVESETESDDTDDEDVDNDDDNKESVDIELDMDGEIGSLNYKYSSDWQESTSDNQMTYTLKDLSGAIMIQKHDAGSIGDSYSEDLTIEMLAEQCEKLWSSMDGMEIVESEWVEGIFNNDKKCYAVTFTYDTAGITTTNTSYFFVNFEDDANDLFSITGTMLKEGSNIDDYVRELLSTASFD